MRRYPVGAVGETEEADDTESAIPVPLIVCVVMLEVVVVVVVVVVVKYSKSIQTANEMPINKKRGGSNEAGRRPPVVFFHLGEAFRIRIKI